MILAFTKHVWGQTQLITIINKVNVQLPLGISYIVIYYIPRGKTRNDLITYSQWPIK
jgi:hypothetical protein